MIKRNGLARLASLFTIPVLLGGLAVAGTVPAQAIPASGPTPILTGYVLGVQPAAPGYQTFAVAPHPGSLRWAEGAVPTPYGQIRVRWARDGRRFSLTVTVPAQATAFVQLPDGRHVTVPGGPHGTTRTFTG